MKVILKPSVQVVSYPAFEPHPTYKLPHHGVPAENIIATAGKVCYDSYGLDGNPVSDHIRNLVGSGHHSVLEHAHVGLFIEGISRGCSHEIVRHRMFNYSQRSTRYTAEGDAAIVLDPFYAAIHEVPVSARHADEAALLDGFLRQCESALREYEHQITVLATFAGAFGDSPRDRRKWCRGKARQLLPHALETRMVMTGNLRAWRHFLVMRSSRHAEAEIRRLAARVYQALQPFAPVVFADLVAQNIGGYVELTDA